MYKGFWSTLPQPFFGLSPMDGVTDHAYRYIQKKYGHPDVVFTEFVAAEGLARNAVSLLASLQFTEDQRPVVAQIFGKEPASFRTAALMLCYLGFDGIDINMGCPAKTVQQHGAGAALIRTPQLAKEIFLATQAGVQDWVDGKTLEDCSTLKLKMRTAIYDRHQQLPKSYQQRRPLPVSIKTRIGYDQPIVSDWIGHLLTLQPAVLTVHGRTLKQGYGGQADWSAITQARQIAQNTETILIGNGDITSADIAYQRWQESGVAGLLVGRATFGNPWLLADCRRRWQQSVVSLPFSPYQPTLSERIQVAIDHAQFYEQAFPHSGFFAMRKHLAWYVHDFPFAASVRAQLVQANSAAEVTTILQGISATIK